MSGTNLVWLEGRLEAWQEAQVQFGDYRGYAVVGTLASDSAAYGGCHTVLFPEEQGRLVVAYLAAWQALGEDGLPLGVHGGLYSAGAHQSVIVRSATYHVPAAVRAAAVQRYAAQQSAGPAQDEAADREAAHAPTHGNR